MYNQDYVQNTALTHEIQLLVIIHFINEYLIQLLYVLLPQRSIYVFESSPYITKPTTLPAPSPYSGPLHQGRLGKKCKMQLIG